MGSYCSKRIKYGVGSVCVQTTESYCCFNSQLARIIQEQGRLQLQSFAPDGNWGTETSPNCIGLTPDQFQMLDFSKIDLSEYFEELSASISDEVKSNMETNVTNYYDNAM